MAERKRAQKNTVQGQLVSARSALEALLPCESLTDRDLLYFQRIVMSREVATWSPHDLAIATNLAQVMRRYADLQTQLDKDGLTLVNERGTEHAHPLLAASMAMGATVRSLSSTLGLSAGQRAITGEHQAGRNKAEQEARKVLEKAASDDLL
jgi:phage terminase small subunit